MRCSDIKEVHMNPSTAASSRQVVGSVFLLTGIISLVFLLLITFLMIFFVIRFRQKRHSHPKKTNRRVVLIETIWTLIPTLLVLIIFFYGLRGFKIIRAAPADAMEVKVIASQWLWQFEYEKGLITKELTVPAGKPVLLTLTSKDVIHSFYVPAFRIKEDAVPGLENHLWFNSTETGTYQVLCAEYCGTGHSSMLTKINVLKKDAFDEWYSKAKAGTKEVAVLSTKARGEKLFTENGCGSCHTIDGSSLVGPTLKGLFGKQVTVITGGKERTVTADEDYLRRSLIEPSADITKGYPDIMPSQKDVLKDDEVAAIIEYIKSLK
jgi:cytochrome c oxidase subunit 2